MPDLDADILRSGLERHFSHAQLKALRMARVGIAGAGGLGSNAAMMLARSGIERLVLVDNDIVEPTNLNRQHYWPRHIGCQKVEALAENLLQLNGHMQLELLNLRLEESNLAAILDKAPIWVEALDGAEDKRLMVDKAIQMGCKIAAASGLCGFGGPPLKQKRMGNLVVVGDFCTGTDIAPPLAPRVTQAAAMLADCVLDFILSPLSNHS